jgi:adenosylhomocysteine nucleosidase
VPATLILTGVELEAARLAGALGLRAAPGFGGPVWQGPTLRLGAVGVGASLLAARWEALTRGLLTPLVISAGVCGGLDPALGAGDLVVPEHVVAAGGHVLAVSPAHHQRALAGAALGAHRGPLVTTPHVVATPEAKAALRAATGAVAVDLESGPVLAAAAAAGCPALVVRAVSDPVGEALPGELVGLLDAAGRLSVARAVGLALAHPRLLPRALTLRRATERALGQVAACLGGLAA